MYKVGVLVNENEVAHSAFANTPQMLHNLEYIKNQKDRYYRFFVFDKFNIWELFRENGNEFIMSFDSLFIATNATNNVEIYQALVQNKTYIGKFISAGKGLFIASQKKLSAKEGESAKMVGFLPEKYDYAIFDRPEKSSAEGKISIISENNLIMNYPTKMTEEYIEYHCQHNNFMHHKYRSFLVANNESQYDVVLADIAASEVPQILSDRFDKSRKILLVSVSPKERIVVSTMALDWAEHTQLVENILIYITEGLPSFAFMLKSVDKDERLISSYILRAKVGKISFRQYLNLHPTDIIALPHNIFVFSPSYTEEEVGTCIANWQIAAQNISVYHLMHGDEKNKSFELYHYTTETSVDQLKSETTNWVLSRFYPSLWGKSVWTYSYAIAMMKRLGSDYLALIPFIYEELSQHFYKKGKIDGSYDNVINASCKLLEILNLIENDVPQLKGEIFTKYPILDLKKSVTQWILGKLNTAGITEFDLIYIIVAIYKCGLANREDIKEKIAQKTNDLIKIYRTKGFINYSNITLCQLLYLIKELLKNNLVPMDSAQQTVDNIAQILELRQDELGQWRNLSETAEVALSLLEIEFDIDKKGKPFLSLSKLNENVDRAIGYLYQTYDTNTHCWYNDINTTVKAAHAIGLYDQVKNYSANDFFEEILIHYERLHAKTHLENSNKSSLSYVKAIYEKDQLIRKLTKSSNQRKTFQWLFFGTFIIALSLGIMIVLMFAGLSNEMVNFNGVTVSVLSRLFNEWQTEFIFGFIGILFGGCFTGIYSYVKRKTFGK